jgi:predicted small secreted protein
MRTSLLLLAATFVLSACSTFKAGVPEDIAERYSSKHPNRSLTSFTPGLVCMDRMFKENNVSPILVTSSGLPDYSEARGSAGYGTKEMLISAISTMSRESGALRYVAYDRTTPNIIALQSAHPKKQAFIPPDFFIRGAITQIDTSPFSQQKGFSLSFADLGGDFENGGLANSNSVSLSTVGLDLNVGMISNFQMLPGITSANSFSVVKRGVSGELSLSFEKVGGIYSLNQQQADALSNALRGLIEVGSIELFGKLYDLPYWECLAELGSNAPVVKAAQNQYSSKERSQRVSDVATALEQIGYLAAKDNQQLDDDGLLSTPLRNAVSKYRAKNDLYGSGVIDYSLYESLYREGLISASEDD